MLDQHVTSYPRTPDGRYMVVRGRLWRLSNPTLPPARREQLVVELMRARRAVRSSICDADRLKTARTRVEAAKRALGERGPVWWQDAAPDLNRHLVEGTSYAQWYSRLMKDRLMRFDALKVRDS
jgi:hypothetical protein